MRQCLAGEPMHRDQVRSIFIIRAPDLFIFTVSKQHASIIPKIWGNFFFSPLSLSLSLSLSLPSSRCPLRLREVQEWVLQLGPSGGCNLLQAVKMALAQTELDSLLVILGSWWMPPTNTLTTFTFTLTNITSYIQAHRKHLTWRVSDSECTCLRAWALWELELWTRHYKCL